MSNNSRIYPFVLDMKKLTLIQDTEAVYSTNDVNTSIILIQLTIDGQPLDLTETTVYSVIEKPDKFLVINNCEVVDVINGGVKLLLTTQSISTQGKCLFEIVVNRKGDTKKLVSPKLVFTVNQALEVGEIVESSNEFGVIIELIKKVENLSQAVQDKIGVVDNKMIEIDKKLLESAEKLAIIDGKLVVVEEKIKQVDAKIEEVNNKLIEVDNKTLENTNKVNSKLQEVDDKLATVKDGKSAYEIAKENGFTGNSEEWIASLKGDKGDKGDRGLKGDKGDKGDQGIQGIQGEQGIQGIKGDKGDQGLKGDKGDKGDKGIQGEQGLKGDQGLKGEQGIQGIKGDKGDQGLKGDKGDKGDRGQGINVLGSKDDISQLPSVGNSGDAWIVLGDLWVWDEVKNSWVNAGNVKGDKGDKGDQGIQGDQGIKGDKGDQGIQGEQGIKGDKGDQGIQGEQGLKGDQGIKGDKGDQGLKGDKGDKGDTGTTDYTQLTNKPDLSVYATNTIVNNLKNKVDDLQVGNVNLVPNSGAVLGTRFWHSSLVEGVKLEQYTDEKSDKSFTNSVCFRLSNREDIEWYGNSYTFRVKPNTKYTISYKFRFDNKATGIDLFVLGSSKKREGTKDVDYEAVHSCHTTLAKPNYNEFSTFNTTFTTAADEYSAYIRVNHNGSKTNGETSYVYFGEIMLVEGNEVKAWNPSIKDDYNAINDKNLEKEVVSNNINKLPNSTDGFLSINSIKGKTIQNTNNLSDIKSVGDSGKLTLITNGVNLFDDNKFTNYETYKEDKQEIILNEPLRSLPNGICDEIVDGNLVRRVGKVVLNGSENWESRIDHTDFPNQTTTTVFLLWFSQYVPTPNSPVVKNLISDKFTTDIEGDLKIKDNEGITLGGATTPYIGVRINKNKLSSLDLKTFKAWLQANPTTVYYPLKTATKEPLKLKDMASFKDGYLRVENEIAPIIDLNYPISMGGSLSSIQNKILTDSSNYLTQADIESLKPQLKGDTGATGAKGDKGDRGLDGAKGDTGATGAKGDKGDRGLDGAKGDTGATGAKGDKGDKGDRGLDGAKGDQGLKGDKGDNGTFDSTTPFPSLSTTDKTVIGAINEVFTDVSSGKNGIVTALTGIGYPPSDDDFTSLRNTISDIKSLNNMFKIYIQQTEPTRTHGSIWIKADNFAYDKVITTNLDQVSQSGMCIVLQYGGKLATTVHTLVATMKAEVRFDWVSVRIKDSTGEEKEIESYVYNGEWRKICDSGGVTPIIVAVQSPNCLRSYSMSGTLIKEVSLNFAPEDVKVEDTTGDIICCGGNYVARFKKDTLQQMWRVDFGGRNAKCLTITYGNTKAIYVGDDYGDTYGLSLSSGSSLGSHTGPSTVVDHIMEVYNGYDVLVSYSNGTVDKVNFDLTRAFRKSCPHTVRDTCQTPYNYQSFILTQSYIYGEALSYAIDSNNRCNTPKPSLYAITRTPKYDNLESGHVYLGGDNSVMLFLYGNSGGTKKTGTISKTCRRGILANSNNEVFCLCTDGITKSDKNLKEMLSFNIGGTIKKFAFQNSSK